MTIVGIGTDLVSIQRIHDALNRYGERFAARVLTDAEIGEWQQHGNPAGFLAKRWAVKEAAAKALGTGIGAAVGFRDLATMRTAAGAPELTVTGRGAATARILGVQQWHVSISDDGAYALAFVLAEGTAPVSG